MNLISCENCGIVINKDRIEISDFIYDLLNGIYENGPEEEVKKHWAWDSDVCEWSIYIPCPACKAKIFLATGETTKD